MKKTRIFSVIVCFAMLLHVISVHGFATQTNDATEPFETQGEFVNNSGDVSVSNGCNTIDGMMPLMGSGKYLETAAAAFLYEVRSDTVLYSWNADMPMYPASLVKMMTALIAFEKGDLSQQITITATITEAAKAEKIMPKLKEGQIITLEQLIYCLLVGSENDAALAIAHHISGSHESFVAIMNQRAKELGCLNTNFVNAHGLHDDAQITTARDIAKILRHASSIDAFMTCMGTKAFILPASAVSEERRMETSNLMITPATPQYYYKYVTGGRTGITEDKKRCLAVTADNGDLSLISVVLGAVPVFEKDGVTPVSFGSYEETKELLDLGFQDNAVTQVLAEGQIVTQYSVNNGENVVAAGVLNTVSTILPKDISYQNLSLRYQYAYPTLDAPIKKGDLINYVQIWYGSVCVATSPVIAMNGSVRVESSTQTDYNAQSGMNQAVQVILIVVSLIIGTAGVLHIVRSFRFSSINAKHKRRMRDRRRSK